MTGLNITQRQKNLFKQCGQDFAYQNAFVLVIYFRNQQGQCGKLLVRTHQVLNETYED